MSQTEKKINLKPPIKWVGGKTQIKKKLMELFPLQINNYFEPFCGGGSVFIELLKQVEQEEKTVSKFIISDSNEVLIQMFNDIKNNIGKIILKLKKYNSKPVINELKYKKLREKYNRKKTTELFMILNKTCFRGLYRENKSGKMNVPFGNYKRFNYDIENLRNLSELFNKYDIIFKCHNYSEINPQKKDFVYFDPPYHGKFNDYTSKKFNHEVFSEFISTLDVDFLLSNSFSFRQNISEEKYIIENIETKDRMNSKKTKSKISEILVSSLNRRNIKYYLKKFNYFSSENFVLQDWINGGPIFNFVKKNKMSKHESNWGKSILGKQTKMWSGYLGEKLVYEYLSSKNKVKQQYKKENQIFDIIQKTPNKTIYYEIKTRNYSTQGTVGEKIFYTPIKYGDILKEKDKLIIILVAYQEIEFKKKFSKGKIFNDFIDFCKERNIEYKCFSELLIEKL